MDSGEAGGLALGGGVTTLAGDEAVVEAKDSPGQHFLLSMKQVQGSGTCKSSMRWMGHKRWRELRHEVNKEVNICTVLDFSCSASCAKRMVAK